MTHHTSGVEFYALVFYEVALQARTPIPRSQENIWHLHRRAGRALGA